MVPNEAISQLIGELGAESETVGTNIFAEQLKNQVYTQNLQEAGLLDKEGKPIICIDEPGEEYSRVSFITIGRGETRQMHVNGPQISRNHCSIRVDREGDTTDIGVVDSNSKNGTVVNGITIGKNTEWKQEGADLVIITIPRTATNDISILAFKAGRSVVAYPFSNTEVTEKAIREARNDDNARKLLKVRILETLLS